MGSILCLIFYYIQLQSGCDTQQYPQIIGRKF